MRAAAWLLALALGPAPAFAWGRTGHRIVNGAAAGTLPAELRPLFDANSDYLVEHSVDPDLWREAGDASEGPNHYLDSDAFGPWPFAEIPHDEAAHLARHGAEAGKQGRVPWRIGEVHRELVAAFRAGDAAATLRHAALLGHYVADAHVPLHSATDYDGQQAGQPGVHARWESDLVDRLEHQARARVLPAAAQHGLDPVEAAFAALRESFRNVAPLLASDRACAGPRDYADTAGDDRYGDAYYSCMAEREGPRVVARLSSAASVLGSLWLSAWDTAGRPALPASFRLAHVRGRTRLVLVSLDGAAAPVVDDAVARGVMPHLARLRSVGATARGSITSLPAKTAAGHATLFTGAWPDRHGVTGNEIPIAGRSVVQSRSGYLSDALQAEPLWVTAARQGLHVTVASATQLWPFDPYLSGKRFGGNYEQRLTLLEGYQHFAAREAVTTAHDVRIGPAAGWTGALPPHLGEARDFELQVAGARVDGLLFDDPADPVQGFDTLLLSTGKRVERSVLLKPLPAQPGSEAFASLALRVREGELGVHFRLFTLSADGSELLLYRSESGIVKSSRPALESAALQDTGGFTGNGAHEPYARGALGKTLAQGGDGSAERRYVETVALTARQFQRLFEFAHQRTRWDVLQAYLPYPDEALHTWLGLLDPAVPGHDPALATRLRPHLDAVLRIVDEWIGAVAARTGDDAVLALASDHGMSGATRGVAFNVVLQKAGLLTLKRDGSIDLFRTRAVYFPGNSSYFLINRTARAEGVVPPEAEAQVLDELRAALRGIEDPATGRRLVTEMIDPRGSAGLGLGGPAGGDLYITLAPGYFPSSALQGDVVTPRTPRGEHLMAPTEPSMQAAFTVSGPGVAGGASLGTIHQIDIAPTLCALLGIDPPAQAEGRVLNAALAEPRP